jgi:multidrug efflux pump subunit AcrA (membrane-fusion protein)
LLAAGACRGASDTTSAAAPAPIAVTVERVALVDRPQPFEAGGVLRARQTADIASRVMAPISVVHVSPGDRVRRGAPLVTLDARESVANRARAAAALVAAAESARSAQADLRAAEAQLALARATHARISSLHEKRSATPHELDQAVAALGAAEAAVAGAQARVASATAAHEAAKAARDAANVGVTYTVLTAPFDGVVIARHADAGSMARPGVPLLTMEDSTAFRLEVQVDEARAASVAVGQEVEFSLGTADAAPWSRGSVAEIGRVDPATHSFLVKVDVPKPEGMRSGSFGRARFPGTPRRLLAVPRTALVRRGQLTFVFLVDPDARARLRPVSAGIEFADVVEILAGLNVDDTVVVNPPSTLVDGAPLVQP